MEKGLHVYGRLLVPVSPLAGVFRFYGAKIDWALELAGIGHRLSDRSA